MITEDPTTRKLAAIIIDYDSSLVLRDIDLSKPGAVVERQQWFKIDPRRIITGIYQLLVSLHADPNMNKQRIMWEAYIEDAQAKMKGQRQSYSKFERKTSKVEKNSIPHFPAAGSDDLARIIPFLTTIGNMLTNTGAFIYSVDDNLDKVLSLYPAAMVDVPWNPTTPAEFAIFSQLDNAKTG
jgi:hypothetical protein